MLLLLLRIVAVHVVCSELEVPCDIRSSDALEPFTSTLTNHCTAGTQGTLINTLAPLPCPYVAVSCCGKFIILGFRHGAVTVERRFSEDAFFLVARGERVERAPLCLAAPSLSLLLRVRLTFRRTCELAWIATGVAEWLTR